jgi:hypothetical protein
MKFACRMKWLVFWSMFFSLGVRGNARLRVEATPRRRRRMMAAVLALWGRRINWRRKREMGGKDGRGRFSPAAFGNLSTKFRTFHLDRYATSDGRSDKSVRLFFEKLL